MDKRSPLVAGMKERVDKLYADGRNSVMTDKELLNMARDIDPQLSFV